MSGEDFIIKAPVGLLHPNQFKNPPFGGLLELVGDEGLEPPTPSV